MRTHRLKPSLLALIGAACLPPFAGWAVAPTDAELAEATRWAAAKFKATVDPAKPVAGLQVLANNDPVQPNARGGQPMRIGDQTFRRGLYCHAVSKVVVRLPGAGAEFTALVGVDSNGETSGGRGSVHFAVQVNGKDRFKSALLREGMAGRPGEGGPGRGHRVPPGGGRRRRRHRLRPGGLGGRAG